jgi:hypothetical protein
VSFPTEEPTVPSTGTTHSATNFTLVHQPNRPENRHIGNKPHQLSTVTPLELLCVACDGQVSPVSTWQAPCQRLYCTACLERFFRLSLEDGMLYLPRCCQQVMPRSGVKALASRELVSDFEGKMEELETQDRTYCSDPACSTSIGSNHVALDTSTTTCPACEKLTCTTCKSASHAGDCPSDPSVQATLALAEKEECQRCQECGRMIELRAGCNHIT